MSRMLGITFLVLLCVLTTCQRACDKYDELREASLPIVKRPKPDKSSAIGRIFARLDKVNATKHWDKSLPMPYYRWECTSESLTGKLCIWMMPYAYLVGMSKCGTTALCNKLELYPQIKFYYTKEVNIFSKHPLDDYWSEFEGKVVERSTTMNDLGKYWFDCSGGTYRDLNAAAYLRKYSPHTKLLFIVRDPWQKLGSYLTMLHRDGKYAQDYVRLKRGFQQMYRSLQHSESLNSAKRYESSVIKEIASHPVVGQFLFAEKMIYWHAAFGTHRLLVLDSYDLETSPRATMVTIERYLRLPHKNFSDVQLYGTSHNTIRPLHDSGTTSKPESSEVEGLDTTAYKQFISKGKFKVSQDPLGKIRAEKAMHPNASGASLRIHPPYKLKDKDLLLYTEKIFDPSLCLFEKLFNKSIFLSDHKH